MTATNYTQYTSLFLTDLATRTNSKQTIRTYTIALNEFGKWFAEQNSDLSPATITAWKSYEQNSRNISNNTLYHYMTLLRVFFKWCERKGLIDFQPIQDEDFPIKEEVKHDIPTLEEAHRLVEGKTPKYAKKNTEKRNKAIIAVYVLSGVRVSELTNIRMGDLDYEKAHIHIPKGKGNKDRFVPFPPEAQKAVKEYIEFMRLNGAYLSQNSVLFRDCRTFEDKPLSQNAVTVMVKTFVSRLTGHTGIGSHDLRHAAASLWDDYGVSMRSVQKALGHSNVQTTEQIYVTILDKEKAAMEISGIIKKAHAIA